jgi:hypothetical protein
MAEEARDLFFAEKELSGALQWFEGDKNSLTLVCPLEIAGVTVEGLRLRASVIKILPDEDLCIQLEHFSDRRKFEPIARFEWRPIRSHCNNGQGPPELRWERFRKTHIHPFEDNLAARLRSFRNRNLPIGIPISPEPQTFEEALETAGKELRINNMRRIPRPPWQARML